MQWPKPKHNSPAQTSGAIIHDLRIYWDDTDKGYSIKCQTCLWDPPMSFSSTQRLRDWTNGIGHTAGVNRFVGPHLTPLTAALEPPPEQVAFFEEVQRKEREALRLRVEEIRAKFIR